MDVGAGAKGPAQTPALFWEGEHRGVTGAEAEAPGVGARPAAAYAASEERLDETFSSVLSTVFCICATVSGWTPESTEDELLALLAFKSPELGFRCIVTERMIVWAREPTPPGAVTGTQRLPPNGFEGPGLWPKRTSALDASAACNSGAHSALCISGMALAGDPIAGGCGHAVGVPVSLVGVLAPPLPEDVRRMTLVGVNALPVDTGAATLLDGVAALDAACDGNEGQEERRLAFVNDAGPAVVADVRPLISENPGPRAGGVAFPAVLTFVQSGAWAKKPIA